MSKLMIVQLLCLGLTLQLIASPEKFFRHDDTSLVSICTTGDRLLILKSTDGHEQILLRDVLTEREICVLDVADFFKNEVSVWSIGWLDDRYAYVSILKELEGKLNLLELKQKEELLILELPPKGEPNSVNSTRVLSVRTKGSLVNTLRFDDSHFMYARTGRTSSVYRIDASKLNEHGKRLGRLEKVDGGQFRPDYVITETEGVVFQWFVNFKGDVVSALKMGLDGSLKLIEFGANGEESTQFEWTEEDMEKEPRYFPVALGPEPGTYYCLDRSEDLERSVYKVTFPSGEGERVYQTESYQIFNVILDPDHNLMGVRVVRAGEALVEYLGDFDDPRKLQIDPDSQYEVFHVLESNNDFSASVIYVQPPNHAGKFLFHDWNKSSHVRTVGYVNEALNHHTPSVRFEDSVEVNELEIPYILNLPNKDSVSKHPLIVMPHGGPFGVFDSKFYDPEVEYLVSEGYAVLRVNFRGSSGYSQELEDAGKKQWGDLMITDILECTKSIFEKDHNLDPQRVGAMGFSYGGYASTMLVIQYPEIFKCAVAAAAVTDINLWANNVAQEEDSREWLYEYVGNPEVEYDQLKNISPLYNAEALNHPILLIHGDEDRVVDIEHSHRFAMALDVYKKEYEFIQIPEGTHNFETPEHYLKFYAPIIPFLQKHLKNTGTE